MCENELFLVYEEYLKKNEFKLQEAEIFLKSFDTHIEKSSKY